MQQFTSDCFHDSHSTRALHFTPVVSSIFVLPLNQMFHPLRKAVKSKAHGSTSPKIMALGGVIRSTQWFSGAVSSPHEGYVYAVARRNSSAPDNRCKQAKPTPQINASVAVASTQVEVSRHLQQWCLRSRRERSNFVRT